MQHFLYLEPDGHPDMNTCERILHKPSLYMRNGCLITKNLMATLRSPGLKVKLLVGPTFVKSHDQLLVELAVREFSAIT